MKKEFFVTTLEGKIYHIHTCMYLYDMRKASLQNGARAFTILDKFLISSAFNQILAFQSP